MKFNKHINRWITNEGLIYKCVDDKLVLCKTCSKGKGYISYGKEYVHRLVYETFNGPIPDGYEIDHVNRIKTDNSIHNLRVVTHKENCANRSYTHTDERRKAASDRMKEFHKTYVTSDVTKQKMRAARLGKHYGYSTTKGWHWHLENGKRVYTKED